MKNLMSRGMKMPQGGYQARPSRHAAQTARAEERNASNVTTSASVMQDIKKQLDEILAMERERIDEWLNKKDADNADGTDQPSFSDDLMKGIAKRAKEALDKLPNGSGWPSEGTGEARIHQS